VSSTQLMHFGPVEINLEKVYEFVEQIPKDASVLELGGATGLYSLEIRRRVQKLVVVEPDARFVRCIVANAGNNSMDVNICTSWISERKLIMCGGLIETDGNHHTDEEIRIVSMQEFKDVVGYDFDCIVVHREDFYNQFKTDYPDFVESCLVLKTFEV